MKKSKTVYINFDQIKENYWNNLNNKLRGFVADSNLSFLDLWVPDEDKKKCLIDIILYAKETGIKNIEFENKRAVSVNFWKNNQLSKVKANKEIVKVIIRISFIRLQFFFIY